MKVPEPLLSIITRALAEEASDIHVDLFADAAVVRFRADGIVHPKERLAAAEANTLINQIRVAGRMDINVAHQPLEGHFRVELDGHQRNVRATIVPIAPDRRAAHLRVLSSTEPWRDLAQLGLLDDDRACVQRILKSLHGLVLVAGPTGVGKTTTLYALAAQCDPERNIVASIEDPVEYDLPFVRQVEVADEHRLNMEEGLRTLLRMDPDVLVIGEISDRESAQIAGHAALAGRLVLSTVHGRDAGTAVEAMHHLGVPFYALGASLRLVIAQRLIRRVCLDCADSGPVPPEERGLFEQAGLAVPAEVRRANGCDACHGYGYRGRTGVFQLIPIDDELGRWLTRGQSPAAIGKRFEEAAERTFARSALQKVADGLTTTAEVLPLFGAGIDRPLIARPV